MMFNTLQKYASAPLFSISWMALILLSYHFWDQPIAYFVKPLEPSFLYEFAQYITELGLSGYYIGAFFFLYLFTRFVIKHPNLSEKMLFLFMVVLTAGALCLVIKVILSRARPDILFDQQLFGFYFFKTKSVFWSFPSGHATTISAVMIGFCFLLPRYWLLFFTTLLLICLSRVIINAHYLSDILAGMYLGGFTVFWIYKYTFWHSKTQAT